VRANTLGENFAYYPYGEERTSTADGRDKFGTYFRDVAGQDYADQRYYGSSAGRFWTVDPGGMATAHPRSPMSWNRYAYTTGDPINFIDSHGRDESRIQDGCTWDDSTNTLACDAGNPCDDDPLLCDSGGGVGGSAQAGGITQSTDGSFQDAYASLESTLGNITAQFEQSVPIACEKDLEAVGLNAADIAKDAISTNILNAWTAFQPGSQPALWANTPLAGGAAAQYPNWSIAYYFSQNPGTIAEAQLGGSNVYVDASWANGMSVGQQEGLMVHEMLHNITGVNDGELQKTIGPSAWPFHKYR
jgi:RHS repeat-associated protein